MPLYMGKDYIGSMVFSETIVDSGNPDTSDATLTSGDQLLHGVTAYGANGKVVGTIPSQTGKTIVPSDNQQIAINAKTYASGDIIVNSVQTETKNITENGTYTPQEGKYFSSVSVNIPSEIFETQSKSVTPSKDQQVITPDNGFNGLSEVIVDAIPDEYIVTTDATALAEDIVLNKTAYVNGEKITGTHTCSSSGGGVDTSDATATSDKIMSGETAYVNGEKVVGTMVVQSYYIGDVEPNDSLGNDGDLYFVRAGE